MVSMVTVTAVTMMMITFMIMVSMLTVMQGTITMLEITCMMKVSMIIIVVGVFLDMVSILMTTVGTHKRSGCDPYFGNKHSDGHLHNH